MAWTWKQYSVSGFSWETVVVRPGVDARLNGAPGTVESTTMYPSTPTLSVDAVHSSNTDDVDSASAEVSMGGVGGSSSTSRVVVAHARSMGMSDLLPAASTAMT